MKRPAKPKHAPPAPNPIPTPAHPASKPRRRIAVGVSTTLPEARLLLWLPYLQPFNHWDVVVRPIPLADTDWLENESFDGCIISIWNESDAQRIRHAHFPVVNISGALDQPRVPTVRSDSETIGRMAARHLLHDCALENLAFVGPEALRGIWAAQRRDAFLQVARQAAIPCQQCTFNTLEGMSRFRSPPESFKDWLQHLPKPVGIFAGDDWTAMAILAACGSLKLSIPADVAVIGVNNDTICALANPSLTSIDRSVTMLILEAARLLDRLMDGDPPPDQPLLIPPEGIIRRESTNILAIGDPIIATAARRIRDKITEPFSIDALAVELGISTRTLQRGFDQWLHCGPLEYSARLRIEYSKELLRGSTKIAAVASASGFLSEAQFRETFKRIAGLTPQQYRDSVINSSQLAR